MSSSAPALPSLAALLASDVSPLLLNAETPKESRKWHQQQPYPQLETVHKDEGCAVDAAAAAAASASLNTKDSAFNTTSEKAEYAFDAQCVKEAALPVASAASSVESVKSEVLAKEGGAASRQPEPQPPLEQAQSEDPQAHAGAEAEEDTQSPPPKEGAAGNEASQSSDPSVLPESHITIAENMRSLAAKSEGSPAGGAPVRRATDRSGDWHPLDAVVERIESHVRPGASGQRLQWCKGFRMPLGAEGRQILLRRLRKAYHANPAKWDEELSRHRIVFSRMPYATVIELFHLAHLLGVFDFAVKCSEEYGSDAAGGGSHRKRRPTRAAGAGVSTQQQQQQQQQSAQAATGGKGAEGAEAAGEDAAAPGSSRLLQGDRKRSRKPPSYISGDDVGQFLSSRPKRTRRNSPAYLRDYETLGEPLRLPAPPPPKKGRVAASVSNLTALAATGASSAAADLAAASSGLFNWGGCSSGGAGFVGGEGASGVSSAPCGVGQASRGGDILDTLWDWGSLAHRDGADDSLQLSLLGGALGGSLGSPLEQGELRDLRALLQQEPQGRRLEQQQQQRHQHTPVDEALASPRGRVYFSAELPGSSYEETTADVARQPHRASCLSGGNAGGSTVAVSSKALHHLPPPFSAQVPRREHAKSGEAAGAAVSAAPGEGAAGSQLSLQLLTTNYTIAAQYLQVIELLAVQRQIMELTQSLSKNAPPREGSGTVARAAAAAAGAGAEEQTPAHTSEGLLGSAGSVLGLLPGKLDSQSLLNQQLLLRLGAETALEKPTLSQQGAAADSGVTASQVSILKDLEQKVSALELLAARRPVGSVSSEAALTETSSSARKTPASQGVETSRCKGDLSKQSAISCSAPESPLDGYDSAAASSCCSGTSSSSACTTPDSLGGERLLLLSSLWQPLPPAEGLASGNL
ncbi:uncharacterized protein LOC34619657 [Cyclospora cayetanensis]|uniref:Uncharacterized protein LOC34619657 n=1 Tax=Cyclospora cayetanensis TaxID=88456 RepID=A0A6P6RQL1_9EIME|nr:uncharacterized protein LOC34619657 [Cyclospora cayetanensis]